jgi:hypothetical protein
MTRSSRVAAYKRGCHSTSAIHLSPRTKMSCAPTYSNSLHASQFWSPTTVALARLMQYPVSMGSSQLSPCSSVRDVKNSSDSVSNDLASVSVSGDERMRVAVEGLLSLKKYVFHSYFVAKCSSRRLSATQAHVWFQMTRRSTILVLTLLPLVPNVHHRRN